jgi:hypothetical protein
MPKSHDVLLERILGTPQLATIVPQLQPEVLHRVIQHYGLEDCGPLVALATPGQMARLFDLDLWRSAAAGDDDRFDAERFGRWLEVMLETGASSAAATLAAMDVELIAAGFVHHVRVFDYAAVAPYVTLDGDVSSGAPFADGVRCEVGGFVVVAKRVEFWDAITAVLVALAEAHGSCFSQVMRTCCRQSHSRPEVDGLDDLLTANAQAMFDVALDREERRHSQGYVTPAQARAFLQMSRQIDRRQNQMPARDPVSRAHAGDVERVEPAVETPVEAVVALGAFLDLLNEAGVTPPARRPLLEGAHADTPRLARIRAHLQDDETSHAELAYLANVIVAGSSIQSRPFTADEASTAAVAVCNLGLENWPARWRPAEDLVRVFQVGWTVLYEEVGMYVADTLIGVLATLECADRDTQTALQSLRGTLTTHTRAGSPWNSRDALDVIAILDPPAWAALLSLIDEFPTMHAAVTASLDGATRRIDAAAFEFIAGNTQIRQVHDFMRVLPRLLQNGP